MLRFYARRALQASGRLLNNVLIVFFFGDFFILLIEDSLLLDVDAVKGTAMCAEEPPVIMHSLFCKQVSVRGVPRMFWGR